MKIIESAWLDYREKVIPADAPDIQIDETRKAFYAGAGQLFQSILRVLGPGEEPTDADLTIMDGIQEELEAFLKDVIEKA
jgi:hypothetical protein